MLLVLGVLQNVFGGGRFHVVYKLNSRECYLQNATYSRIKPIFYKSQGYESWLTECTRKIERNNKEKFPTDIKHIERVINYKPWDLIICFGKQAEEAFKSYNNKFHIINVPHPVSWQWRKTVRTDIQNIIKEKMNF